MVGGGDHRRDYMDRRVSSHKRVTSPTLGPLPPCKQAQNNVDGNEKDKKVIGFYQQNKRLHVVEQKSKKSVTDYLYTDVVFLLLFKNRQARERINRARVSTERENVNPPAVFIFMRALHDLLRKNRRSVNRLRLSKAVI